MQETSEVFAAYVSHQGPIVRDHCGWNGGPLPELTLRSQKYKYNATSDNASSVFSVWYPPCADRQWWFPSPRSPAEQGACYYKNKLLLRSTAVQMPFCKFQACAAPPSVNLCCVLDLVPLNGSNLSNFSVGLVNTGVYWTCRGMESSVSSGSVWTSVEDVHINNSLALNTKVFLRLEIRLKSCYVRVCREAIFFHSSHWAAKSFLLYFCITVWTEQESFLWHTSEWDMVTPFWLGSLKNYWVAEVKSRDRGC